MSQKTNPISLRLEKKNQNFASPWFTDFFFTENLKDQLEIKNYIDSFLEETGNSNALFSAKACYRKLNIFLAIQDTRAIRKEKQLLFNLKSSLSKRNRVAKENNNVEASFILSKANSYESKVDNPPLSPQKDLIRNDSLKSPSLFPLDRLFPDPDKTTIRESESSPLFLRKEILSDLLKEKLSYNPDSGSSRSKYDPDSLDKKVILISYLNPIIKDRPYISYCETLLSKESREERLIIDFNDSKRGEGSGSVNIYPIRFIKSSQNVIPLIDLVILLLERRVSFKEIKDKVFKDLSKNKMIRGVRIQCSGRFAGKSKKAQKAKMQSDQWGQTSLSTFSSKLLFANKSANTSYGKIGVKIWIAFI